MRKFCLAGILATATIGSAALAGDTPFTPDAAATWSARTLLLASIAENDPAPETMISNMGSVCNGLTGEQMKHEYGKEPRWALASQITVCAAYDGYAGKFRGSKHPCDDMRKAMKDLDNASTPGTPPEVVSAAATLRAVLSDFVDTMSKRACRR